MRLKILILPTFIIIELILAISYIKPNIDEITTKQSEISLQKDALSRVDSVAANITAVGQALESRSDTVAFIERYYPKTLDEERVVDMLNYLAQKSGLIVTALNITKNEQVITVMESVAVPEDGSELELVPEAPPEPPESYEVEVSVFGAYQNIKDFFRLVYQSDRLHTTKEFSITYQEDEQAGAETEGASPEPAESVFLTGSMTADFQYIKEKQVANALNIPLFQSSEFDFKAADSLITFVTTPLPPLETGGTGKINPFE